MPLSVSPSSETEKWLDFFRNSQRTESGTLYVSLFWGTKLDEVGEQMRIYSANNGLHLAALPPVYIFHWETKSYYLFSNSTPKTPYKVPENERIELGLPGPESFGPPTPRAPMTQSIASTVRNILLFPAFSIETPVTLSIPPSPPPAPRPIAPAPRPRDPSTLPGSPIPNNPRLGMFVLDSGLCLPPNPSNWNEINPLFLSVFRQMTSNDLERYFSIYPDLREVLKPYCNY